MKINCKKTKILLCNPKMKADFMPQLSLRDGLPIETVEEIKLFGVIVTSDLKWKKNTKNIIRKAYKRMWIVKRLKSLSANLNQLKLTFVQQARSILEVAVPAWHPGLTVGEKFTFRGCKRASAI